MVGVGGDQLQCTRLHFFAFDAGEDQGLAGVDLAAGQGVAGGGDQVEQFEPGVDVAAGLADAGADFFCVDGGAVLAHFVEADGLFQRAELFALDVLDELGLQGLDVVEVAENTWDLLEAGALGSEEAALAGNDF
jgi:hypothetical protein